MYKIIGADHKEYGPVPADQLRQWISEGRVNGQTRVQAEGTNVWKPIAEVAEFAALFPGGTPAATTGAGTLPPPHPTGGIAMPSAPKNNQLAIWSMVSGIVAMIPCCCCPFIFGVTAIILGFVAQSQLKANPHQKGSGFATAGIVLGIIGILIGIAVAVYSANHPEILEQFKNSMNQMNQQ